MCYLVVWIDCISTYCSSIVSNSQLEHIEVHGEARADATIEAGDVESGGATAARQGGGADKGGHSTGLRHGTTGAMRQSGDR